MIRFFPIRNSSHVRGGRSRYPSSSPRILPSSRRGHACPPLAGGACRARRRARSLCVPSRISPPRLSPSFEISNFKFQIVSRSPSNPPRQIPPRPKRRRRDIQLAHRVSGGKKVARSACLLRRFSRAILFGARHRPWLVGIRQPKFGRAPFAFLESRLPSAGRSHKSRATLFYSYPSPLSFSSFARHKGPPFFLRSGVFLFCRVRTKGPVLSRGCLHYISTHSALLPHPSRERSKEATTCKDVPFVS
jgi:hypothetical protein